MANEPGWFPDPWRPGRRRWWDGQAWTDHTHDPEQGPPDRATADPPRFEQPPPARRPAGPPPLPPPPPANTTAPDPHADLALEQRAARRAHPALALQAAGQVVNLVTTALAASELWDSISGDEPATVSGWQRSQNLAVVPVLVSLVLLLLWSHRVAQIAHNLHYPARRSPGWAVAGWLVPIVNLWFPYRSLRDSLAPGNPDQRLVGRWWACYIASTYWTIPVFLAAIESSALGLAVALPGVVAALVAARLGWEVVDAILADHTAAIGRIGSRPT